MASEEEAKKYHHYVVDAMNTSFGTAHPKDHTFTDDELLALTPEHIYAYLATKAYGTPNPTDANNPTLLCSNTLQYMKKALSYYMPNKLMEWNVDSQTGNPTRSVLVNKLIELVKKKEVRKEGNASSARR